MGNANIVGQPTTEQFIRIQLTRSIASIPSIFGAIFIIRHVLRTKKRRRRALSRILLGMSSMDLLFALTTVFSSTIIPSNVSTPPGSFAHGTWASCEAFGFLGQGSSVASVIYNASLTVFYLLSIRYGWSEWRIHNHRVLEPALHAIPLLIGWGPALALLFMNQYNPLVVACGIVSHPPRCETENNPMSCQRGRFAAIYRTIFLDAWLWGVFLFLVAAMLMIYCKLAQIDRASPSSYSASTQQQRHQRSRRREQQSAAFAVDRTREFVGWSEQGQSRGNDEPATSSARSMLSGNQEAGDEGGPLNSSVADSSGASWSSAMVITSSMANCAGASASSLLQNFNFSQRSSNSNFASQGSTTNNARQEPQGLRRHPSRIIRRRQQHRNGRRKLNRLKHDFATQSLLYCLAYALTWFFFTTGHILQETDAPIYIPIVYLINIFQPLQGFWNAIIYFRPRFIRYRRKKRRNQERRRDEQDRAQQGLLLRRAGLEEGLSAGAEQQQQQKCGGGSSEGLEEVVRVEEDTTVVGQDGQVHAEEQEEKSADVEMGRQNAPPDDNGSSSDDDGSDEEIPVLDPDEASPDKGKTNDELCDRNDDNGNCSAKKREPTNMGASCSSTTGRLQWQRS